MTCSVLDLVLSLGLSPKLLLIITIWSVGKSYCSHNIHLLTHYSHFLYCRLLLSLWMKPLKSLTAVLMPSSTVRSHIFAGPQLKRKKAFYWSYPCFPFQWSFPVLIVRSPTSWRSLTRENERSSTGKSFFFFDPSENLQATRGFPITTSATLPAMSLVFELPMFL